MPLAIVSVCADPSLQDSLQQAAKVLNLGPVSNIDHYITPSDEATYKGKPNTVPVAVVCIDANREAGFQTAELLRNHPHASFRVIIATTSQDSGLILGILREGKYGFLSLPANVNQILAELRKFAPAAAQPVEGREDGKVLLFAGVHGGAGTTTLAVHTAVALAESGKRTLLIDYHRSLGHAALYLGLPHSARSFYDVLAEDERLDESLLSSYVVQHESGLDVLCSPDAFGGPLTGKWGSLTFERVVTFLRNHYDCIIVDASARDPELGPLVSLADWMLLVVSAEVAPARNLTQFANFYSPRARKIMVIVNHEGRSAVSAADVAAHVSVPLLAAFPYLNGVVVAAVNAGHTVAREHRTFFGPLEKCLELVEPEGARYEEPRKKWNRWWRR